MARGGRKSEYAGYYLHIEPGNSFLAGGVWMPESNVLNAIRQEIDYNGNHLLKIIRDKNFKKYFNDITGEQLVRNPKEYPADHPNIYYLKFKSFNVVHDLADKKVTAHDFLKYSIAVYKAMKPLNDFLNSAVEEARNKS
jgi:uncharacterized protein (TIGR02453 family)